MHRRTQGEYKAVVKLEKLEMGNGTIRYEPLIVRVTIYEI